MQADMNRFSRTLLVFGIFRLAQAADTDGAALYKDRCAICHEASAETRAPALAALRQMSAENVVRSLESGLMKEQGATLSAAQKRTVAEFLTGKTIASGSLASKLNACSDTKAPFSPS